MKPGVQYLGMAFILTTAILLATSSRAHAEEGGRIWHQAYEPVEDAATLAVVQRCLIEATRLFGEPSRPIRAVHVRSTRPRAHPARLARADIHDPVQLARMLIKPENPALIYLREQLTPATLELLTSLNSTGTMTVEEQLTLTANFNRMITDPSFFQAPAFSAVKRQPPAGIRIPNPFSRSNPEMSNRKTLESLLPNAFLPVPKPQPAAKKFNLCEVADRERGIFVLYLSGKPGSDLFYLELAHETAHLLNADIFDWYVEGLNNAFAKHMAEQCGWSWKPWEDLFAKGAKKDPYALSHAMMSEVMELTRPGDLKTLLSHTRIRPPGVRFQIDIDAWISTLPPQDGRAVTAAIRRYSLPISRNAGSLNSFSIPRSTAEDR